MSRLAVCIALFCLSCRPPQEPGGEARRAAVSLPEEPRPEVQRDPPAATPAPEAAALPRGVHSIPVPGFETAIAAFPERGAGLLPIVIAAHGAGDSPEWQCRVYRELLGSFGVVLCPAGPRLSRGSEGRYFPEHFTLERVVLATLSALVDAFPDAVDAKRVVYTGYSQGATMGALMLPAHGSPFRRLALVEGGYSEWTQARARRYAETGGERVLFACGTQTCTRAAERSSALLVRAGVDSRVVSDHESGHTYGAGVGQRVTANLPWLLEGL